VVFKVDVKPLTPGRASIVGGDGDQPGTNPLPPHSGSNEGVEEECVDGSIPGDIDEADKLRAVLRIDPAQAVLAHLSLPVAGGGLVAEALGMQRIHCGIAEIAPPLVSDHLATVGRTAGTSQGLGGAGPGQVECCARISPH